MDSLYSEPEPNLRIVRGIEGHVYHLKVLKRLSSHFINNVQLAIEWLFKVL